jgi:hypothetical protein
MLNKQKLAESVKKATIRKQKTLQRKLQKKIDEKLALKDFIICPLCFKETNNEVLSRIKLMTKSHLQRHGYTFEQFKNEFPNHQTATNSIRKNQSLKLSGSNHFNYNNQLSLDTKRKISLSVKEYNSSIIKKCEKCGKPTIKVLCKDCRKKLKNNYLDKDTENSVYCRICHIVKKNLQAHIKKEHGLTVNQYKSLFECEVYSEQFRKNISKSKSNSLLSDEQKQKIRQSSKITHNIRAIEKLQWENNFNIDDWKEYTEKDTSNLIDTADYSFCRICLNKMKMISSEHLYRHKLTSSMYIKLFPHSVIIPKNIVMKLTIKTLQTKKNRNIKIGRNWGYGGYRKDIDHYVRSMVEANFCRILKVNNIRYIYEPQIFKLNDDKFSIYSPDLKLLDDFKQWKKDTYIELKKSIHDEDKQKIACFLKKYPLVILNVIEQRSQNWRYMKKEYQNLIPLWEDKHQNIRVTPELYKC